MIVLNTLKENTFFKSLKFKNLDICYFIHTLKYGGYLPNHPVQ